MNDLVVAHSVTGKPLPPEGIKEIAEVSEVVSKNDKKFTVRFSAEVGTEKHICEMDILKKWAPGSPLVKLVETLLGSPLKETDLASFDLRSLIGKKCQIVTANARGAGNKLRCVVTGVLRINP